MSDDAQTLNEAMSKHFRTGNIKKIFAQLDEDGSGYIDMGEAKRAVQMLAAQTGLELEDDEIEDELDEMDEDGNGDVSLSEFTTWWKSVSMSKKEAKLKKQADLEAAGFLEKAPKPPVLKLTLQVLFDLKPSIGLSKRAFAALEDMCPDDDTFDALQDAYNLCELKRMTIKDKKAFGAVCGLEALCLVPLLLKVYCILLYCILLYCILLLHIVIVYIVILHIVILLLYILFHYC
eukprot:SAG31_NODE_835_length_11646_cov_11.142201_10_plen_234_part_00